jgi:hypothetical protein
MPESTHKIALTEERATMLPLARGRPPIGHEPADHLDCQSRVDDVGFMRDSYGARALLVWASTANCRRNPGPILNETARQHP